jgi:exodeoxyribonuclease-3
MKIATWNINGLRSAEEKMLEFLKIEKPDILCLQEIKVDDSRLPENLKEPNGYRSYWFHALRPGYSGVAVYTKEEPIKVEKGLGIKEFDHEGRTIVLHFKKFALANFYFPHSRRSLERLDYKVKFNNAFLKFIKKQDLKKTVFCGDFNVAHEAIDLARPRDNVKNAGFTEIERGWMDRFLSTGLIDVYRKLYPEKQEYTWWTWRNNARERNIGWRIDYFLTSKNLLKKIKDCYIGTNVYGSDHVPVIMELDI